MAYLPAFDYDIFISYSHVDNEMLPGQLTGWIEQFYKNLNLMLSKRIGKMDAVKIWWDNKKLDGSKLFDESIATGIERSAIMLSLVSPGYLASDYCRKELDLFYKKTKKEAYGVKIGDRFRIFNVLINNIHYNQWPAELTGTTGFVFHDAAEKEAWGDPLDPAQPIFISQMKSLRDAIVSIFEAFPAAVNAPPETEKETEQAAAEDTFTIYFGEVADTLRTVRKRTIGELEKKGYQVLCGVPPPDEEGPHEKKITSLLAQTQLSVHLLDQYPGKEMTDAGEVWYPQRQAEIALRSETQNLIWMPSEMEIEDIEEEKYKTFIQDLNEGSRYKGHYELIRGSKSAISQQITDLAEQLKAERHKTVAKDKVAVLLDTHFNDQLYAMDVGRVLLENEIQPFINPQEDDPRKNINLLADRISQVSKLIFFYGKVSRDWVLERMSAALQLIVTHNFPVEDFYVYMAPPHKQADDISLRQRFLKINIIDNSNSIKMDDRNYRFLLKELKGFTE